MKTIPVQAVPSQLINVVLSNQNCQISVYQKAARLYVDVSINNVLIVAGTICENLNRIIRSVYLGFVGDLLFVDSQGTNDPVYLGLGSRFFLIYLEPGDLA